MAKSRGSDQRPPEEPRDFPNVTPRDLYPTSDIRFVLVEIGRLASKVDRLIDDVNKQDEKLDKLLHQSTYIKGFIAAGVVLVSAFIWIASVFLSEKWNAAVEALRAVSG